MWNHKGGGGAAAPAPVSVFALVLVADPMLLELAFSPVVPTEVVTSGEINSLKYKAAVIAPPPGVVEEFTKSAVSDFIFFRSGSHSGRGHSGSIPAKSSKAVLCDIWNTRISS